VLIIEAYLFGGCFVDNGPFSSEETVKARMKHILEKLDASDPTQAVTIAAGTASSMKLFKDDSCQKPTTRP